MSSKRLRRALRLSTVAALLSAGPCVGGASAQTLTDVVSFLLINRSVATGDFVRDEQAALATRDGITTFLLTELGTLPNGSSSGGFTYRLDPTLGASVRASESFGPVFTDRALTSGALNLSFGISFQQHKFQTIDGRSLGDGSLVATAARLRSDTQPFDVETLTLHLSSDIVTLHANAGLTDRIDVGGAIPMIKLTMSGQRIDDYRGTRVVQATASGTSIGPGDAVVRVKYNLMRDGASGFAVAADVRLPTGDASNLLGTGQTAFTPRAIASLERGRSAIHGNAGFTFGGPSKELDFGGGVTYVATPRITLVAELAGRRLGSVGRLTSITIPHPTLANVDTIRLTTTDESTMRLLAIGGVKWNIRSSWLLIANVLRPLTTAGLNTSWSPTITIERTLGF